MSVGYFQRSLSCTLELGEICGYAQHIGAVDHCCDQWNYARIMRQPVDDCMTLR